MSKIGDFDFDNVAYMDYDDVDFQLRKGMRSAAAVYDAAEWSM